MLKLLKALFDSPEAEGEAEPWATRAAAHFGIGALICMLLMPVLGPWIAAVACALTYAAWEVCQWPGGRRMAWDGVLDWCAVTLGATAVAQTAAGAAWTAAALAVTAAIVAAIGIRSRS